jgi:hypothetical protein
MYCISKSERRQGLKKNKMATKQTDSVRDSKQIWPWIEKQNKLSPELDWPTTEVKGNELSFSALDVAMMDGGRPRRTTPRARHLWQAHQGHGGGCSSAPRACSRARMEKV